ncbi:hypothetical protein A0J48_008025 [Sphaerospermopsis aphanizomenoides BCCUSP55]|uniref:hypothetical protein n=1 Tax=Sphaerospermopsis aphanizomenoides TaxID=459663 RepID=UPI0019030FF7|nr:hypothetical protein [Sphaerospermopsis aphanizomenoides]MBK1987483.1 hypothetical protein [Sphaerospermopsis aphanizomenoides BCCUSP55]
MLKIQRIFITLILIALQLIYPITKLFTEIKYFFQRQAALKKHQEILNWVKTQNLPLDTSAGLQLPDHLLGITHDNLVKVLHSGDDKYYVAIIINHSLNITGTTYKARGLFVCDSPLNNKYLSKIPGVCHRINILGEYQKHYPLAWAFNLEVEHKYNDSLFAVYRQL